MGLLHHVPGHHARGLGRHHVHGHRRLGRDGLYLLRCGRALRRVHHPQPLPRRALRQLRHRRRRPRGRPQGEGGGRRGRGCQCRQGTQARECLPQQVPRHGAEPQIHVLHHRVYPAQRRAHDAHDAARRRGRGARALQLRAEPNGLPAADALLHALVPQRASDGHLYLRERRQAHRPRLEGFQDGLVQHLRPGGGDCLHRRRGHGHWRRLRGRQHPALFPRFGAAHLPYHPGAQAGAPVGKPARHPRHPGQVAQVGHVPVHPHAALHPHLGAARHGALRRPLPAPRVQLHLGVLPPRLLGRDPGRGDRLQLRRTGRGTVALQLRLLRRGLPLHLRHPLGRELERDLVRRARGHCHPVDDEDRDAGAAG